MTKDQKTIRLLEKVLVKCKAYAEIYNGPEGCRKISQLITTTLKELDNGD